MRRRTIQSIKIDALKRAAQDHERPQDLLGMALKSVKKSDAVTSGAWHHVFALDERPYEPGLVPNQSETGGQAREFLDYFVLRIRLYIQDYVARLKATGQAEQPTSHRCRQ